jgi:hypothetical protein
MGAAPQRESDVCVCFGSCQLRGCRSVDSEWCGEVELQSIETGELSWPVLVQKLPTTTIGTLGLQ